MSSADATANLERWKSTEGPEVWVRNHAKGWNHADWLELLASLRASECWPMEEAAVGKHLESIRDRVAEQTPQWMRELLDKGYRQVSQEEVLRRRQGRK